MVCRYIRRLSKHRKVIRPQLAPFSSSTVSNGMQHAHSPSMESFTSCGAVDKRQKQSLYKQYEPFTHGGSFWRDNYRLNYWIDCEQPVVYLGNAYGGFELRRRLGDWCWLSKDPASGENITIKFISRSNKAELRMAEFIREHCENQHICTMRDSFKIPHHLTKVNPTQFTGIEFTAMVYPLMGTDLRRVSTPCEHLEGPHVPLTSKRRKQCIRDIIYGVAGLHRMGIVHGDIHAGNCALPPPPDHEIERHLAHETPSEDEIRRKDGRPTHPNLPVRVTEPIDLGFGEGNTKIFDFGFAFHAIEGACYNREVFPSGTPLPPELIKKTSTELPFKVDSWQLGLCIFFILTDGAAFLQGAFGRSEYRLDQYEERIALIADDQRNELNELIPIDLREGFRPVLLSLLHHDPACRASAQELLENNWLINEQ